MTLFEIIIWTIVLLSFIFIIFLYVILYIKRRIYEILNEDINVDINLDSIDYPKKLYTNEFNASILRYLIKILIDFNNENTNNIVIYSNKYDKIYYIYYNKKK